MQYLIIPGCMWGMSYNNSFSIAMLEPSGWLTSMWCSIMGLVGIVIRGALVSIVVLYVGPWPRAVIFCLWTYLPVWIEFHNSNGSVVLTCAPSMCDSGNWISLPVQPN